MKLLVHVIMQFSEMLLSDLVFVSDFRIFSIRSSNLVGSHLELHNFLLDFFLKEFGEVCWCLQLSGGNFELLRGDVDDEWSVGWIVREVIYSAGCDRRCKPVIRDKVIDTTFFYIGISLTCHLVWVASAFGTIRTYIRPSFAGDHVVKGGESFDDSVEVSAYKLRAWGQLLELHFNDEQEIVSASCFFGSDETSGPPIYVRTYQGASSHIETEN